MLTILIIGGYGVFGGRLAQLLADDSRLTLIIAGRSHEKADAFLQTLPAGAQRQAIAFDREKPFEAQLSGLKPDLIVDATGPFQAYGDDSDKVVRAAIAIGANYLDLADGSDFVAGVTALDAEARAAGVFALSGASSFPVLSAAVIRNLSQGLERIDDIAAGIAPSPYAGVGLNVIRAIASYAGKPIRLWREGGEATGYGLIEARRRTIRPPGMLPLDNTRFSLVDVPDLLALPKLWPGLRSTWTGAGPVPEILHLSLSGLAWLVRWRILPTLAPLVRLFHGAINVVRWGEHRGGMFVEVDGVDGGGESVRRCWHMIAEGDDGPLIPSMTIEGIVRKMLDGRKPQAGARSAIAELELADYDSLFARRAIRHGAWSETKATAHEPLYKRILATAWNDLPANIRKMHASDVAIARGLAEVTRGTNLLSRAIGALFRFPDAGREIPVTVRFAHGADAEVWTRSFGDRSFSSRQDFGRGRYEGLIKESFGTFSFGLALVRDEGKLRLIVRRWSMLGVALPRVLAPYGEAFEEERDGRFRFHVEISLPLIGLIVLYRGWLEPDVAR